MIHLAVLLLLATWVSSIKLNTGGSNIFSRQQEVYAGYLSINDEVSVYYQYFESMNSTRSKKNLLFYFGSYLSRSAIVEASFGFIPYLMIRDPKHERGVRLEYNPWSVNEYASIVVADIVRGSGFSQSNSTATLSYKIISQDMETFVQKFLEQKPTAVQYANLLVYAGYQMVVPTLSFLNSTKLNIRAVLHNSWLGYSTIDQVHILLPAFGFTDRIKLDNISNQIYSLQVNDYSKDIDEMFSELQSILSTMEDSSFIDFNNPMVDQSQVKKVRDGANFFYGNCTTCRVYLTVYKDDWSQNSSILEALKKDLIKDARQTLFDTTAYLSKNRLSDSSKKDLLYIQSGNCPKTNTQCLEEVSTRNFITDSSFIYSLVGISKYFLQLDENTRLNIEECRSCGFYPFLENWSGASPMISLYVFIFNETNVKSIENEFAYKTSQMLSTTIKYFSDFKFFR